MMAVGLSFSIKGAEPWEFRVLFVSTLLIAFASLHVHLLSIYDSLYDLLPIVGKMTKSAASEGKGSVAIWNAIIPLILGGIGVNLFCSWLLAKKPEETTAELLASTKKPAWID